MTSSINTDTGERSDLLESLNRHRSFLRFTVRDLTDEQAAERPTRSELCLGGLLKHVAATEQGWVNFMMDGATALGSADDADLGDRAREFSMLKGETLTGLLEAYDQVAARTDEPGARWSARRVLLHIIAETAQHAGHADILREAIDGQKTMG